MQIQKEQHEEEQQDIEEIPKTSFLLLLMSRRGLMAIFGIILGLAAVGAAWSFAGKRIATSAPSDRAAEVNQEESQKEIDKLVERVRKHILLPENEEPVVATVVDAEALIKEQPFYANVINGDRVLIYTQRQQAVIYSPKRDILVNVGPVQIQSQLEPTPGTTQAATGRSGTGNQQQTTQAVTPALEITLTVEVRNGSGVAGAAALLSNELTANPAYAVIQTTDAAHNDYTETLIVNLADTNQTDIISNLAALTGATVVTSLPAEEVGTQADALIIIGAE